MTFTFKKMSHENCSFSIHEQGWNLIFQIMCKLGEIVFASERRREIHRDHGK